MSRKATGLSRHSQKGSNRPMFAYVFALLERVKVDRKGVTAMEYGVIAAGIVLVVATAAATLGTKISTLFGAIGGKL
jgi:pilus assembly protein Flp/PilA